RENENSPRPKRDHIRPEPDEHLWRGLPADAAIDIRLARKGFGELPSIGYRVAKEDNSRLAPGGSSQLAVCFTITRELREVLKAALHDLEALLVGLGGVRCRSLGLTQRDHG